MISYIDILDKKVDLHQLLSVIDVLKIESIGENFEVSKRLLALAAPLQENFISSKDAMTLRSDKGRIRYSKQQFIGFKQLLLTIQEVINKLPNLEVMNSIDEILLQFNKTSFHQHLTKKGIAMIPAIYNIKGFDDLLTQMKKKSWSRVFIKPNHSSSASGVIAFRRNGDKMQAITSVEFSNRKDKDQLPKLYNSLKISTYNDPSQIKRIVDFLAMDGLLVEKWIPKARTIEGVYDFRMVVVGGKAKHIIARQSKLPMTNLHLGNKRGNLQIIKEDIGQRTWDKLIDLAQKAATALPYSLYSGLDILLSQSHQTQYVIEANAFGDLLPNLVIDGMDTYESQINYYKSKKNA